MITFTSLVLLRLFFILYCSTIVPLHDGLRVEAGGRLEMHPVPDCGVVSPQWQNCTCGVYTLP
ncbi:hypothetical protein BDV10DRAFT_169411 [Aspergillus recurvatus]